MSSLSRKLSMNPKNKRAKKKLEELAKEQRAREMMQESRNKLNGMMSETVTKDGDKTRKVVEASGQETRELIAAGHDVDEQRHEEVLKKIDANSDQNLLRDKREAVSKLAQSTRKNEKQKQEHAKTKKQNAHLAKVMKQLTFENAELKKKHKKKIAADEKANRDKLHQDVPVIPSQMTARTGESCKNSIGRISKERKKKEADVGAKKDAKKVRVRRSQRQRHQNNQNNANDEQKKDVDE